MQKTKYKPRLLVSVGKESFTLRTKEIACIYRDKLIIVVVDKNERRFLYNRTLTELENELDPHIFFRANRKFLINIDFIKSYKTVDKVKLEVSLILPSKNYRIIISQENAAPFKKWLQGDL